MTRVRVRLGAGTETKLTARGHEWTADEPVELKGTDRGPNPYELLLGSLGACTALTLRLYSDRKGWPLESVDVEYSFERVHAEDCAECKEERKGLLDVIRAKVVLKGPLDEAQRERLTQIVSRCPVHKTLAAGPEMFEDVTFSEQD